MTPFTVTQPATITLRPTVTADDVHGAAVTGQILLRVESVTGFGVPNGNYELVTNENCNDTTDACGGYPRTYIGTARKPDGTALIRWRFIVAHELGHATAARAKTLIPVSYDDDDTAHGLCRCTHVTGLASSHCLQSRERSSDAQDEGYAHAFATRVFNSTTQANGNIRYFKEFKETDGGVTPPTMTKDAYNAARWHETRCGTLVEHGVEWDWLTFFFKVSNTNGTSAATTFAKLQEIYLLACDAGSAGCYSLFADRPRWNNSEPVDPEIVSLKQAAAEALTSAQYLRFKSTGENWGVDW